MATPPLTRLVNALGIKTRQQKMKAEQVMWQQARKEAFLHLDRAQALKRFPELGAAYTIFDDALHFYQDILISAPTTIGTNYRNQQRAKAVTLDALKCLDSDKEILPYSRDNRHEEAALLRAEELRAQRMELAQSFRDNARINPDLHQDALSRYAQMSLAYFSNPQQALQDHAELNALTGVKKQAQRYFKQWLQPEHVESAVKDCINRAITDIAYRLPPQNAEEIKAYAKAMSQSPIGTQRLQPQEKLTPGYCYEPSLMAQLIGRNGLETGFWPYDLPLFDEAKRIESIDEILRQEQCKSAFLTLPKEQALNTFPMLAPLYRKKEAAVDFYCEKLSEPLAKRAAALLVTRDLTALFSNEPLQAVSEIKASVHESIIEEARRQLALSSKHPSAIADHLTPHVMQLRALQESHFVEQAEAANEFLHTPDPKIAILTPQRPAIEPQPEVAALMAQIVSLQHQLAQLTLLPQEAKLQQEQPLPEQDTEEKKALVTKEPVISKGHIDIDSLRSTAGHLPIHQLFQSSHRTKVVASEQNVSQWDIASITQGLHQHARELAYELLGEPLGQENNQLRFGSNKGSLIITIAGEKSGLWFDHQTGEGGNLLQLIQHQKGLSFKEALDYAGEFLQMTPKPLLRETVDVSDMAQVDESKQAKIAYARQLANISVPVKGTVAETYLMKTRGIDPEVCSDSVRFIPALKEPETGTEHPALLVIGKSCEGVVQGVQAIFLTPEGKKLDCQEPKRSYGLIKGSAIALHEGGNLYGLAEGVETALSVATALPQLTVFASLGSLTNFSAMNLQGKKNTLIVFADNDGEQSASLVKTHKAISELTEKGMNVLLCMPPEPGQDFNDVLRKQGIEGVKRCAKKLQLCQSGIKGKQAAQGRELALTKKHQKDHGIDL